MCAEYNLKTSERDLAALLDVSILNSSEHSEWEQHTRLFAQAPVVLMRDGQICLEEIRFSLLPPGGRIPFTANARVDDWDELRGLSVVYQRPTWRDAFLHHRCVIPVSEIIEPIYSGEYAGQMMGFADPDAPVLFVAGIYKETLDVKTGEVYAGFSMLTDFAHPFVRATGHHRTVITLPPDAALEWIKDQPIEGKWGVQFLLRNKGVLNLNTRPIRTMKNWKTRVNAALAKGEAEDRIQAQVEAARAKFGFT